VPPEIVHRVAPSPGTVQPGNLYVDLQTLTLWLGVTLTVDPDGAKLVSDIDGTLQLIAETLQDANAYTNQEVATRAPINSPLFTGIPRAPTPPPGDDSTSIATTAFVKAAAGSIDTGMWAAGMIMAWGGVADDVGIGVLADWAVCNGTAVSRASYPELWQKIGTMHGAGNGTTTFNLPDLRERFIMGAGYRNPGLKNLSTAVATTDMQGSHKHTISGHQLTVAEIPYHEHTPGTLKGDAIASTGTILPGTTGTAQTFVKVGDTGVDIGTANISLGTTGGPSVAGNGAHTHDMIIDGLHAHTVDFAQLREAVPYYTLCYIIRLRP
jgi:microcystin-dependent protein